MTLQEIQDLAGHRDVPPWVVKLVGDAVARERELVAVFLEKECEEQYLADRVRSREFNGAEKWMK